MGTAASLAGHFAGSCAESAALGNHSFRAQRSTPFTGRPRPAAALARALQRPAAAAASGARALAAQRALAAEQRQCCADCTRPTYPLPSGAAHLLRYRRALCSSLCTRCSLPTTGGGTHSTSLCAAQALAAGSGCGCHVARSSAPQPFHVRRCVRLRQLPLAQVRVRVAR